MAARKGVRAVSCSGQEEVAQEEMESIHHGIADESTPALALGSIHQAMLGSGGDVERSRMFNYGRCGMLPITPKECAV